MSNSYASSVQKPRTATARESKRIVRKQVILATSASGSTPQNPRVRISKPSARLRLKLAVGFWGEAGSAPTISTSTITSLTPLVLDAEGNESSMDASLSGGTETLPYAADIDSAADAFALVCNLVRPSGSFNGAFKAVATWEADASMSPEEWEAIAAECVIALLTPAGLGIGA